MILYIDGCHGNQCMQNASFHKKQVFCHILIQSIKFYVKSEARNYASTDVKYRQGTLQWDLWKLGGCPKNICNNHPISNTTNVFTVTGYGTFNSSKSGMGCL